MLYLRAVAFWCCAVFTVLPCTAGAQSAHGAGPYELAVQPAIPPVTIHTLWAPVLERLRRQTGLDLRLKVYEKMSDFERDLSDGVPDFVFVNPLQAVVAHGAQGYLPLVRGSRLVSAELFVRRDSPIRSVDDLTGRKIALVGSKNL